MKIIVFYVKKGRDSEIAPTEKSIGGFYTTNDLIRLHDNPLHRAFCYQLSSMITFCKKKSRILSFVLWYYNNIMRHWFGRFKRKSIIVSKSLQMVDITIAFVCEVPSKRFSF